MHRSTNPHQFDETLNDTLAYAESIIDTVREALLVLDGELRIRTASRSFCRVFHVSKEETEGFLLSEIGNGQWDLPELRRLLEQVLCQEGLLDDYEVEHEFPEIGRRIMRVNARRVLQQGKASALILLAIEDVTERKRSHEALLRQSEQLRLLWDSAAVLLTAPDPQVMLQEMFRRVREHLEVDAYFNFVVSESGEYLRLVSCGGIPESEARSIERLNFGQAVCGTVAQQKQPIIATYIQQSDDPKTELVKGYGIRAYACNPLIYQDRLIGTLSFASRTQDAFEEEELAFFETVSRYVTVAYVRLRLVEELQEAHRRKDGFLAMLAHELRNPLAPIRSGLDVLAMEETAHQETIELMQAQMSHVVRLVDDLMDVSRIVRGKVELRKEPVELAAVIGQSIAAVQSSFDSQQQELTVEIPEDGILLDADPVRIVQILENLLNNASKYTDAGGRIEVTAECQGSEALIRVRDTGIGIAPELLPVVFDLFTQSPRSLDRAQGGLGIGLTLVKNLVQLHGGMVTADSEGIGKGSTFEVRLPMAKGATVPPVREVQQPTVSVKRRILAVDDNIGAARMLSILLTRLGDHEVEIVHDGASVLAKVQEFQPEIILLDIGLPQMNGYEVCRAIRQLPEFDDVLLVALTGYGQEDDQRKSKEAGFEQHLVKPPSVRQIKAILSHPKLAIGRRCNEVTRSRPHRHSPPPARSVHSGDGEWHREATGTTKLAAADAREVKHDVNNTVLVLQLMEQMLAAPQPDANCIRAVREGLKLEVDRLSRLVDTVDDAFGSMDATGDTDDRGRGQEARRQSVLQSGS